MMRESSCRALFLSPEYAPLFDRLAEQLPVIDTVFVRDGDYEDGLAAQPADEPVVTLTADDEFMVRHSGGTTGRAKGLPLTSAMWINALRNVFAGYNKVRPGQVSYHFAPITHASGTLFFITYLSGDSNFMVPAFDVDKMVARLQAGGISNMFLPPTALRSLVQNPGMAGFDPTPVKGLMIGGSTIAGDRVTECGDAEVR